MTVATRISSFVAEASSSALAWQQTDIVAGMLLLVLGMALGIGLVCLLLVLHYMRSGRLSSRQPLLAAGVEFFDRRNVGSLFTTPPRWLAIRSGNPYVVQAALGLHKPTPCSWEEGLSAAQESKLFISPPINGWILVMGSRLPDPSEDVDVCFQFLAGLSRKIGQVQFFSVSRAVNHHAWAHFQNGQVFRGYAWAGKTVWNQGRKTAAETELGLCCYEYAQAAAPVPFSQPDPLQQNTDRVYQLARRWSIDPAAVDLRRVRESPGISGELSRSKAH